MYRKLKQLCASTDLLGVLVEEDDGQVVVPVNQPVQHGHRHRLDLLLEERMLVELVVARLSYLLQLVEHPLDYLIVVSQIS